MSTTVLLTFSAFTANMWGWNNNQWYPPLMSAWCKLKLGWSDVVHVSGAGAQVFDMGPACSSAEILYVDHRLKDGEYFLIEYRFPCGFDKELAHVSDWRKDRSGAAIWHVDESGLQSEIDYRSEGISGQSPLHYAVALVQGDGAFNLEREYSKGGNNGDAFDLLMDCKTYICGKSKRIDGTGITKADGTKMAEPSTRGYAGGTQYATGITIEVGTYLAKLNINITLEGVDPEPNTYPGINKKGLSPGLSIIRQPTPAPVPMPSAPTPYPSPYPTPLPTVVRPPAFPTRLPTRTPTRLPTRTPTRAPTRRPTRAPTRRPTRKPTRAPTRRPI